MEFGLRVRVGLGLGVGLGFGPGLEPLPQSHAETSAMKRRLSVKKRAREEQVLEAILS